MAKRRLGRVESQQKTRETLVHAAEKLFLKNGYAATSLEKVALKAGFSKGAVYSNFKNKDELCLAVLDALHAREVAAIAEAFTKKRTLKGRIQAFEAWAEKMIGDEAWTRLEMEVVVAGRDGSVLKELGQRDRAIRDALTGLVMMQFEAAGAAPKLAPDTIAVALLSLGIGLGFQRMVDPTLSVRPLIEVMRLLLPSASDDKGDPKTPEE